MIHWKETTDVNAGGKTFYELNSPPRQISTDLLELVGEEEKANKG